MPNTRHHVRKISLFGNFGTANFGNECTLQAMLYHLRRLMPDAKISCICSVPEVVTANFGIAAVSICETVVKPWNLRNPVARWARRLFIGVPCEIYRWLKGLITLYGTDVLIVVGTGLVTDAFGIAGWGPYSIFKWSVIAKLCGCRLAFVSVGAGPLERRVARLFVKSALSLAKFRSYRDKDTLEYLKSIGFRPDGDCVYPDLAFSLPAHPAKRDTPKGPRPIVGLGVMLHTAMYGSKKPTSTQYETYLRTMVAFVEWLLERGYDIRLLIGDLADLPVAREVNSLLKARSVIHQEERIIAEPIACFEDLLSRLTATDFVVATRFHNVLLALFLGKPSIAISFHHKCSSLMGQMGLSEYGLDITDLKTADLIQKFRDLESNSDKLKVVIKERGENCRVALNQQYKLLLRSVVAGSLRTCSAASNEHSEHQSVEES
jgi:polysaccharide pyruvyl transferase WcaK-like protein